MVCQDLEADQQEPSQACRRSSMELDQPAWGCQRLVDPELVEPSSASSVDCSTWLSLGALTAIESYLGHLRPFSESIQTVHR